MPIEIEYYGNATGGETHTVTLNCGALKAVFCDFGARLLDVELIVTGEVSPVAGTPYDFRVLRRVGEAIQALDQTAGREGAEYGFDRNWVLRGEPETMRHAATAVDYSSGRRLDVSTTAPGVHFYTAGGLSEADVGKGNAEYCRFAGYCFETQHFPDSPNQPHFPSARLDPGEVYDHRMKIEFSIG